MSLGVPVKLLHESQGHIVTCELKTGEVRILIPIGMRVAMLTMVVADLPRPPHGS